MQTQLYTVTFQRHQDISVFDKKGKLIDKKQELIEQTICDLPLQTAKMYRDKTENCIVMLQVNEPGRQTARREKVRFLDHERPSERSAKPKTAHPAQRNDRNEAARTGDMTAAINGA